MSKYYNLKKKKKWYRRLFSCIRIQQGGSKNDDYYKNIYRYNTSRSTYSTTSFFQDEFEYALAKEGLLYRRYPYNGRPVLNICVGFDDEELSSRIWPYVSFNTYKNSVIQQGFEKITQELYYNEPIVDGLPASLWLECIEPTLAILTTLNKLKHRRSNLVIKKPRPDHPDSSTSHHGDSENGVIAVLTRRIHVAMRNYQDRAFTEIVSNVSGRHQNRRRNLRRITLELNQNQSANTSSIGGGNIASSSLNHQDDIQHPLSTRTNSQFSENDIILEDIEHADEISGRPYARIRPTFINHSSEIQNERGKAYNEVTCDNVKTANSSSDVRREIVTTRRRMPSRRQTRKPRPYLYFWKTDLGVFEKIGFRDYPIERILVTQCAIKYFLHVEDERNEDELCNRLSYLAMKDSFTRMSIMTLVQDFCNNSARLEMTDKELAYTQWFLDLEGISSKYNMGTVIQDTKIAKKRKENRFWRLFGIVRGFFQNVTFVVRQRSRRNRE